MEVWSSLTLYPWNQQYPIGSNFLPDLDIMGFADRGVNAPPPPVFGFPWSQAISRWASESCFVIDAICVVSSEIVLDMRLTDSRSAFVAVAKFARATLWSCCISVNISAQDSTLCRCAEYPKSFEVFFRDLFSLKAFAK